MNRYFFYIVQSNRYSQLNSPQASASVEEYRRAWGADKAIDYPPLYGRWLLERLRDKPDGGEWTDITEYDADDPLQACYMEFTDDFRMFRFDGELPGVEERYYLDKERGELIVEQGIYWVLLLTDYRMELLSYDEGLTQSSYRRCRRV